MRIYTVGWLDKNENIHITDVQNKDLNVFLREVRRNGEMILFFQDKETITQLVKEFEDKLKELDKDRK